MSPGPFSGEVPAPPPPRRRPPDATQAMPGLPDDATQALPVDWSAADPAGGGPGGFGGGGPGAGGGYGGGGYGGGRSGGDPSRVLLVVVAVLALVLLTLVGLLVFGGGSGHSGSPPTSSTTSTVSSTSTSSTSTTSTTSTTTTTIPTTTTSSSTTSTTSTTLPAGGTRPPTVAQQLAIDAAAQAQWPNYQVAEIDIADSDPTWAALLYQPDNPETGQAFREVRHLSGGTWVSVSFGTAQVACVPAVPASVQADFAAILGSC